MNFNFSYDIYPHPPLYCNYVKTNAENAKIFSNALLQPEHQNQLDCRSKSSSSTHPYFLTCTNANIPSVGYYKHYFQNIDIESKLLQSKPAKPISKPYTNNHVENCIGTYDTHPQPSTSKIWNNNTKRKIIM